MRDIEKNRWEKMEKGDKKEQEIWNYKHLKTKINKTSLEYNPITLEYYKSQGGEKLEQTDALSTHRTSVRAAKLYYKNNTFDPIKGLDINIKESKKKISISNQPEEKHPNFNQKTMEGEDEKKKNCLGKKLLTETSKTSLNLQRLNSHLVSNKKQKEIIENFPNSKFVNGLYDIDQDKFNTYWARRF
ncbi:hypothetical protein HK099_008511 [Clydaea vesicula]|uniref:Uncharacterized protein n=1 Tax=Clydaea vesicula TaxID=447962 RepID=A0AAD5TXC3_9FUNG|nr:hypothetical protein HK099_008511 [Clydaea vesicula]